jgi:hypothetical protein
MTANKKPLVTKLRRERERDTLVAKGKRWKRVEVRIKTNRGKNEMQRERAREKLIS